MLNEKWKKSEKKNLNWNLKLLFVLKKTLHLGTKPRVSAFKLKQFMTKQLLIGRETRLRVLKKILDFPPLLYYDEFLN